MEKYLLGINEIVHSNQIWYPIPKLLTWNLSCSKQPGLNTENLKKKICQKSV